MKMIRQTFKFSSEVLTQEIAGETVLLDLNSESYFGLDEVGTRIWQLLLEQKDLQSVIETLLIEYDVERKQLEKDVEGLVTQLVDAGFIT